MLVKNIEGIGLVFQKDYEFVLGGGGGIKMKMLKDLYPNSIIWTHKL